MSPEQARGLPLDQRTDVWGFGCVLYEMLSGRSAFGGRTISDTIAKILEREPDWRALPRSTPRTVRELIRRCLQKDLPYRLRSLAVARDQIEVAATRLGRQWVIGPLRVLAGATLAVAIVDTIWWQPWKNARVMQRESAPTRQHQPASTQQEPVGIVIADFQNTTQDPAFDRTLEPMLRRALEGASFISAYDRSRIRPTFGVRPPEQLDDGAARALATKEGLAVVLSGSIARRGNDYEISVKAADVATDHVLSSVQGRTSNKDQVLGTTTKLVTTIRRALGDETSDSAQLFAMRGVSATSLDVLRHYAAAIEAQSDGKMEGARSSYQKTVELDPNFGLGYQGLALISRNLGRLQDADKYTTEALKHLEGMTDREQFAVRASSYIQTGDYHQCVKEYGELTARYAADATGHNNRAMCLSKLRNMREAVDEMRQAVRILPKHVFYRANLAVLADYTGDFRAAQEQVGAIQEPTAFTSLALAFSQLGLGLLQEATATYEKLATMPGRGASWSASGLGDLALYEGHFSEAVRMFEQGASADIAAKTTEKAARKLTSMGYAQLLRGQDGPAIAAAEKALVNGKTGAVRFLAARVFVQAGAVARARIEAARISLGTFVSASLSGVAGGPASEPEAYAKIIEAEIALKNEDPRQAIRLLIEANTLADTWLGHFDLGLAYLKVPVFAEADAEFDHCLKRRGEALALFFDEEPTYGFFPPVFYFQGVAREGLNRPDSADSFRAYLAIRGKSSEDSLLHEIRRHLRQ
jgi:eukaryotic-like serine/threonine-protein kinase